MLPDSPLRVCSMCGDPKDPSDFSRNGQYVRTYCKSCQWAKAKPPRQQKRQTAGYVDLICSKCKQPFRRLLVYHERNLQRGDGAVYCSPKCFPRNPKKVDDMSPFVAWVCRLRARCRNRGLAFDLTPESLRDVWDAQGGVCPFTGWDLQLFPGGHNRRGPTQPDQASVDRIDQASGYVVGNIRFISLIANLARSEWSDADVLRFCRATVALKGGTLCR